MTEDETFLRHVAHEFEEGFNCGDVDRIMRFYSDTYVDVNPFHRAMRLLAQDVAATIGEQHVAVVWSVAKHAQGLQIEDPAAWCVEEVQQHFQDTFVDTTWPACPRHPNHPLDFAERHWRCPRDGTAIAPLGALPRLTRDDT